MSPLVKLEPLEFELEEPTLEYYTEEPAEETVEETAEEPAKEPAEEPAKESVQEPVIQSESLHHPVLLFLCLLTRSFSHLGGAAQRIILGGLLDMLGPPVETKKRNISAVTMDTRGWKRYKGDPLQMGLSQTPCNPVFPLTDSVGTSSLPPNPVSGSSSGAIYVTDDDDDDEHDFHTANSGSTTTGSRQPTCEEDNPHIAATTIAPSSLNNPIGYVSDPGSPQATAMATPTESDLYQVHGTPSHFSHTQASMASAVSLLEPAPFISFNTDSALVDHRGYPLSDAAMGVARQYWESLRQFERCPFGPSSDGPMMPSVDLLVRTAQHRQRYTELILGLDQAAPGTRTFEPPYVAPVIATSCAVSDSSHYDLYSSMNADRATGAGPTHYPSQAPGYGTANASFQGDNIHDHIGNSSQFGTPNNGDSPSHKSSPYEHVHHSHAQNNVISSHHQTDIPNPTSTADNSGGFAGTNAEPVSNMVTIGTVLNDEQRKVVDLAAAGHNIFYTGSAGSGKSTILQAIKKRLEDMGKTVRVMAPTGKVALAINGTTTWTFAGWTPESYKRGIDYLKKAAQGRTVKKRFRGTDAIIIDEISMVDNLHLERLNQVMKAGRAGMKNTSEDLPFGGVQVIATGDFFQLPPIAPFQICLCGNIFTKRTVNSDIIHTCSKCYMSFVDNEKWAFRSRAWEDCGFIHIQLGTIHRQCDPEFIAMLQKCRKGVKFTPREVDLLMKHPSVTPYAVKLFSTREEVRRTNDEAFRALAQSPHSYRCFDKFDGSAKHPHLAYKGRMNANGTLAALADHRFDPIVELKQGMPVVLLVNDLTTGLANGSQGIITGFEPHDASQLPLHVGHGDRTAGGQLTTYPGIKNAHTRAHAQRQRAGLAWPIVKFFCGVTRTIYPVCHVVEVGDEAPYSLLCRTQVPLTAGYAMSIHRSQGLTLDRVIVDLSRVFEDGQVYVALSRARDLRGLKIEGNPKGLIVGNGNKEVRKFMKEKFDM